jgi:hypothetical protein
MWAQRVMLVSDKLHRQFPEELHGRIEAGTAIAKHPKRFRVTEGAWEVADLDTRQWFPVNGSCPCGDTEALEQWCKHRVAANIVRRAREIPESDLALDPATYDQQTGEVHEDGPQIDPRFVEVIKGKPFVQYRGLLAMATARGLCKLEARIDFQSAEIVYASATATFTDGRVFTEAADATPQNVKDYVRPHFPRMALTRAKARCLRDALNIGLTCAEELEQ